MLKNKIQLSKFEDQVAFSVIHELGSIPSSKRKELPGAVQNGRLL